MSVVSALTVMLLYLIIIRLIREFKQDVQEWNLGNKVAYYGGGLLVGSLTLLQLIHFGLMRLKLKYMQCLCYSLLLWFGLH